MQYKTHVQVGKVFTLMAMPVAIGTGVLPEFPVVGNEIANTVVTAVTITTLAALALKTGDVINIKRKTKKKLSGFISAIALLAVVSVVLHITGYLSESLEFYNEAFLSAGLFVLSIVLAYHGGVWGSGYPDLDCEGSSPDRRNPRLGKLMRGFGVVHRGKFSHSLDAVTLTFFIPLVLVIYLTPEVVREFANGAIVSLLVTWIVFAYVGAVSHLFGDAGTKTGVRIFFFLKPFRYVPNIRFFRTGETWEGIYRWVFNILVPVSFALSAYIIWTGVGV